jgi:hypothetical protein
MQRNLKGDYTMEKIAIEKVDIRLSEEEIKKLETAKSMPITFDEDCPETTPERAVRFRRVNNNRHVVGEN